MNDIILSEYREPGHHLTMRDIVQVGFRHQRALLVCFSAVVVASVLYCLCFLPKYESETKILLTRDRVDPILTPAQQAPTLVRDSITEEDVNSEVEILLSADVLRKVVTDCGLDQHPASLFSRIFRFVNTGPMDRGAQIEAAAGALKKLLVVDSVKKANVIQVAYRAPDPQLATNVLQSLNAAYLVKHLEAHRPSGQLTFFEQKTSDYAQHMQNAEEELRKFSRMPGSVRPELVRDITLQKLADATANLSDVRVAIAATQSRMHVLDQQAQTTPPRVTTAVRQLDNPELLKELKNTLLTLELRHTELRNKFQPDYRPVKLVEEEILKTKAAIAAANTEMLREQTTDVHPIRLWIDQEREKDRADLNSLQGREAATLKAIGQYQATVHDLQDKGIEEENLALELKAAQDDYLLYRHKREEARISDSLDQRGILNVAIVEQPTVPYKPVRSIWFVSVIGIFLASILSASVVFTLDYLDPSFRTPGEVQAFLNAPVLTSVPLFERPRLNSNGSGNGQNRCDYQILPNDRHQSTS